MGNNQSLKDNQSQASTSLKSLIIEEEEKATKDFICCVCYEQKLSNKKFNHKTGGGTTSHNICTDCTAKFIRYQVEGSACHVRCPIVGCPRMLDPISCRPLVPATVFNRWCDNLFRRYLLGLETCHCPSDDCRELILNECGGGGNKVMKKGECPRCKKPFCLACKKPWHVGFRCYVVEDQNDVLFRKLMERRRWKRCPRCGHGIERRSGCSQILCRCRTRFCYDCGEVECGCRNLPTPSDDLPLIDIVSLSIDAMVIFATFAVIIEVVNLIQDLRDS